MKLHQVLETVLYTANLDAAKGFYAEVLGLELAQEQPGRYVFFKLKRQMLLLFDPALSAVQTVSDSSPIPPHGATGQGHVCFEVSSKELDDWKGRLKHHGVEIESEISWPAPRSGRSVYFRDPAGNSLEFAEAHIWGFE